MDRRRGIGIDWTGFVDRLTDDVHDPPERPGADRNSDRQPGIDHRLAANQAFGCVHGNRTHGVFTKVLGHFKHQTTFRVVLGFCRLACCFKRVQNFRQTIIELHVDNGTHHLANLSGCLFSHLLRSFYVRFP